MIAALKNSGEVVAEILMTRQAHRGAFLVLEGPDDSRFWESRVSASQCEIVIGGCKTTVVRAVSELDTLSFGGVVGVVDDDCDGLRSVVRPSTNLLYTDARDLEGVLLRGSALRKVLAEYGDRKKVEYFESQGETVRDALLRLCLPLGRLRWFALANGVDVNFKRLSVKQFVDVYSWAFDESALLSAVVRQGKAQDLGVLQRELAKLVCSDPWLVCQGHDLVQILGYGLERVLGNENPGEKKIGALLRAGLEEDEFRGLGLYRDVRSWESANPPYCVLR